MNKKNERNLILSLFYSYQISIIRRKLIYLKFFFRHYRIILHGTITLCSCPQVGEEAEAAKKK